VKRLVLALLIAGCARGTDHARLSTPALEARVRTNPGNTAAADALGERYVKEGRAREAENLLAAAAARDPKDARLQSHLGVARAMQGDRRGARAAFDRAIALDPALTSARENRARLALEEGDLAVALTHTREVARLKPADAGAQERLGDLLSQLRDYPAAATAYAAWARLQPQSATAWSALGAASIRADRFREAVRAYRALGALRALTPEEEAFLGLAIAEAPADDAEAAEAERLLRGAIDRGQSGPAALYGLGLLASRKGRWAEAVLCFRGAVKADPDAERPRYRLARALLKAGRRAEAERELAVYDRLFRERRAKAAAGKGRSGDSADGHR
jgi:tetratricopeptide (TPR) repeat protein